MISYFDIMYSWIYIMKSSVPVACETCKQSSRRLYQLFFTSKHNHINDVPKFDNGGIHIQRTSSMYRKEQGERVSWSQLPVYDLLRAVDISASVLLLVNYREMQSLPKITFRLAYQIRSIEWKSRGFYDSTCSQMRLFYTRNLYITATRAVNA